MKKIAISIQILFTVFLLYADNKFKNLFNFDSYKYTEHSVNEHGWLEHDKLQNTGFSECQVIKIEKLKEIPFILYYPIGCNAADLQEGMFEINNQKFIIHDIRFDFFGIKILSVSFENKKYMLFLGGIGKYGEKICFIFDITNPGHIVFYPPENRFVEAGFDNAFFGLYQNKFCFFFSEWGFKWNGQYWLRLSPYFIDGDALKELRDKNGNPYFVIYEYTTKYKQGFIIEEKNIPN